MEVKILKYKYSLIASAALYFAGKIVSKKNYWSEFMILQTCFTEEEVKKCAFDLCYILRDASCEGRFRAVFKKYSSSKYSKVALLGKK